MRDRPNLADLIGNSTESQELRSWGFHWIFGSVLFHPCRDTKVAKDFLRTHRQQKMIYRQYINLHLTNHLTCRIGVAAPDADPRPRASQRLPTKMNRPSRHRRQSTPQSWNSLMRLSSLSQPQPQIWWVHFGKSMLAMRESAAQTMPITKVSGPRLQFV